MQNLHFPQFAEFVKGRIVFLLVHLPIANHPRLPKSFADAGLRSCMSLLQHHCSVLFCSFQVHMNIARAVLLLVQGLSD